MLAYFSLNMICSSKLIVYLELRSEKTVRSSEQIVSAQMISEHISALRLFLGRHENRKVKYVRLIEMSFTFDC